MLIFLLPTLLVGALLGGVGAFYLGPFLAPLTVPETAPLPTGAPSTTGSEGVAQLVKNVLPGVVTVVTKGGSRPSATSVGSGFIVDAARGFLVTNNHVITDRISTIVGAVEVSFDDGTTVPAKLIGRDPQTDIAVLQINAGSLHALTLADSDAIAVGSSVIAIGSALGDFRNSVTGGLVSAKGRRLPSESNPEIYLENLLQTDAAISPGNSGGPLLSVASGQVIGMNTLVVRETGSEGLGFAIASNTIRTIVDELISKGRVERGFIGINYLNVNGRTAVSLGLPPSTTGVLLTQIGPNSPAALGGLKVNDVIVAVNDERVESNHPLQTVMLKYRSGDRVRLNVLRVGALIIVEIVLGRQ